MSEPCLRVANLHVSYDIGSVGFFGKRRKLHAVNDVSFDIAAGETLGLVGESGSGKSTAGLAILRLIDAASGSVRLGEDDVARADRGELRALRRRMQMVFQDPYSSLNPSMTVAQLLEEPLLVHTDMPKPNESRGRLMLESVGLHAGYAARYPHEFSGGQRQRIAIARAMMLHPELVVPDEPVSALDVSTQSQILNLLKQIQGDSGTAFLLVAHDLAVVRLMSPRVAVMYLGEIVETGPSDRVYDEPGHPYTAALISAVPFPDPERQRTAGASFCANSRARCPAQRLPVSHALPVRDGDLRSRSTASVQIRGGGAAACHLHAHGPRLGGRSVSELVGGSSLYGHVHLQEGIGGSGNSADDTDCEGSSGSRFLADRKAGDHPGTPCGYRSLPRYNGYRTMRAMLSTTRFTLKAETFECRVSVCPGAARLPGTLNDGYPCLWSGARTMLE